MFVAEFCAGAGGQAIGLSEAGFRHAGLIELDKDAAATLSRNFGDALVTCGDMREVPVVSFKGVDMIAAGLPCPPFSVAGQQLGPDDERDLFPTALRIVQASRPKAVMIENVRGFLDSRFDSYRGTLFRELVTMGYSVSVRLYDAREFEVPQTRKRVMIVAIREQDAHRFHWPEPILVRQISVGESIGDLMASRGWEGASAWAQLACEVAPTIVGGSKKHGGPDLGPTRARAKWLELGVDGRGIANEPPGPGFSGTPRLTVPMVARLQGFPDHWEFIGRKTSQYRQVGNACPPPLAREIATAIRAAIA